MVEQEVVRRIRVLAQAGWGHKRIAREMGVAATGWRFLARSTRIGPPAPRRWLAPSSQPSDFLNGGRTDS
ncbi:hypothetical protein JQX13_11165 [Archangium violaceum]|nr:hypothetical protein [Archangium violaceum]QRK10590.1 hypothetical protein JQX13_11165 [Archangium violaceum]